jgi:hypothetical protein
MEFFPPAWCSEPPGDLSFGAGGIEFLPIESIAAEQAGYVGPDWNDGWLVVARETACGDPIFVDRTLSELPVLTANHGAGGWDASPVAPSWSAFFAATEAFRPFTIGREHPVGVQEKPLSTSERRELEKSLQNSLGSPLPDFWDLLIDEGAP